MVLEVGKRSQLWCSVILCMFAKRLEVCGPADSVAMRKCSACRQRVSVVFTEWRGAYGNWESRDVWALGLKIKGLDWRLSCRDLEFHMEHPLIVGKMTSWTGLQAKKRSGIKLRCAVLNSC